MNHLVAFARRLLELTLLTIFLVLIVDVLWGVFTRYAMSEQARWSEELARVMTVWLAMLGAALAHHKQEHLGIGLLVDKLHQDARRIALAIVQLLILGFAISVMIWGGGWLCFERLESGQLLPALGIPKAFTYLAVPVSGSLISLFSIHHLISLTRNLESPETQG
jgi:TRAP-type C4-dicarboxylate transport system permease small subunit